MKRRWVQVVVGAIVLVVVAAGVWATMVWTAAGAAKSAAQAGLESLRSGDAAAAQAQFSQAESEFARTRGLLAAPALHGVPVVGRQLEALDQLTVIGTSGSAAGSQLAQLMAQAGAGGSSTKVNELVKVAKPYLLSALDSVKQIGEVESQLSTDGLLPPVSSAVTSVEDLLAPVRPLLTRADSVSAAVRYLLDSDHRFLLVSQNSAELRATGGFMGSYGLVKIGPSGFKLEKYADIYSLPWTPSGIPRPEGQRMGKWPSLMLWDANWWLDFPTSGKTILTAWDRLQPKQPKVDGVIAIDLVTIQTLLKEFGPIELPQYGKTITAENMVQTLIVMIDQELVQDTTHRKDVLRALSEKLLSRMMNLKPSELLPTVQLLGESASQKHLQLYTRDAGAQKALNDVGWGAAIQQPADTTDVLAVNNSVVWPSKMNFGVHKTIDYQVALNAQGTADTTLTLNYAKDSSRLMTIWRQWFGDYLRVYRPAGTTLTDWSTKRSMKPTTRNQKKAEIPASMAQGEVGLAAITNGFSLLPGENRTQVFRGVVPSALVAGVARPVPGGPKLSAPSGEVFHYRLLVVRQSDLEDNQANVTVTAPAGWRVSGASAWQQYAGQVLPMTTTDTQATLSTPLTADTIVDVTLVKG